MLHIVQGGIENGDKAWLQRAAKRGLSHWWVTQSAQGPGTERLSILSA
jgi:hypothetical protein